MRELVANSVLNRGPAPRLRATQGQSPASFPDAREDDGRGEVVLKA
jgi:hypothetical protein